MWFGHKGSIRLGSLDPGDFEARLNAARVLGEGGSTAIAAERYRQATDIYGSSVEGWCKLGQALSELGRRDEARAALQEALASYRTAPWYRRSEDRPWKRRAVRLLRPLR